MKLKLIPTFLCLSFVMGGFAAHANEDTPSPPQLARHVVDKSAEEASDAAGRLLREAIKLGGEESELRSRIVITTAVLFAGASSESDEVKVAVAKALIGAAGQAHEALVAAVLGELARNVLPGMNDALDAAVESLSGDRAEAARLAAANPRDVLGMRLIWAARKNARDALVLVYEEEDPPMLSPFATQSTKTTFEVEVEEEEVVVEPPVVRRRKRRPSPTPVGRR